jgi:ubiquinone/menaquinone biosynthesis C-methylase UbiE
VETYDLTLVKDVMTPGIISVSPSTILNRVMADMVGFKVHRLFVVDDQRTLVGVVSALDVLRYLSSDDQAVLRNLRPSKNLSRRIKYWFIEWKRRPRGPCGQSPQEMVVGFYSRVIFPRLCDRMLNQPLIAKQRQELLADARGDILEIGFGTGLNLAHYPKAIRKITVVDPNAGMHWLAQSRIRQSGMDVDHRLLSSEHLPFEDGTFDCVVSTFTMCSIPQVSQAVGEVHRVLKAGGRFFFLEHGLSPEPSVQKWQRRLNRLQMWLGDGCHLDRNIRELVTVQSFSLEKIEESYLEKTPKTHGYVYRGVAAKSGR